MSAQGAWSRYLYIRDAVEGGGMRGSEMSVPDWHGVSLSVPQAVWYTRVKTVELFRPE